MDVVPSSHATLEGALTIVSGSSPPMPKLDNSGVLFHSSGGTGLCLGVISDVSQVCTE